MKISLTKIMMPGKTNREPKFLFAAKAAKSLSFILTILIFSLIWEFAEVGLSCCIHLEIILCITSTFLVYLRYKKEKQQFNDAFRFAEERIENSLQHGSLKAIEQKIDKKRLKEAIALRLYRETQKAYEEKLSECFCGTETFLTTTALLIITILFYCKIGILFETLETYHC